MYEGFFGFTGKPFQLNPDPSFYFASRGHKRAFAYLEYGLYQSEGFIVITGEIGAGKTTVLRNLLDQLDPAKVVAAQIVSTQLDADELLRSVGVAFGLPVRTVNKAVLLASIEAYLCQLATEKKRALLVVDEAQNLSPRAMEELRMLSNFQFDDQALLQSFLVGQPELRQLMQRPEMQQLRQRVIASYHLGPLDASETRGYVEHRLRHVGWKNDPAIAAEAFPIIHELTGGIPRRINSLCNRLLLATFLAEKHAVEAADVDAVADELNHELGPQTMPASTDSVPHGASPSAPSPPNAAAPAAAPAPKLWHVYFEQVEDRIDRLERTVAAAVDLLYRLLHPDKAGQGNGEPGEPKGTEARAAAGPPGSENGTHRAAGDGDEGADEATSGAQKSVTT